MPKHRMSVMADGCSKCYHYANAGRMQLGDVATSTPFFGEVARKVQDDFADGTVTSAAQQKYAQHCATVAGDDDSSYSCSSNLSCSRASASARGVVDIAGTAGVACAHGQPGRGLFVAMPTPEQHTYHIRTLLEALKRRPDIQDIYIDIGCRLKGALMEAVRLLVAGGKLEASVLERASAAHRAWALTAVPTTSVTTSVTSRQPASALTSSVDAGLPCPHSRSHNCPPPALQLNVLLPWMHGFDHDLPCQLENSGLYKVWLLQRRRWQLPLLACCHWPAAAGLLAAAVVGCSRCCRGWLWPLLIAQCWVLLPLAAAAAAAGAANCLACWCKLALVMAAGHHMSLVVCLHAGGGGPPCWGEHGAPVVHRQACVQDAQVNDPCALLGRLHSVSGAGDCHATGRVSAPDAAESQGHWRQDP